MIFFCGDTHGRFEHVIRAVHTHRPDAIVLLGDIQAQRPLEDELAAILALTEVWFIHGNHDTDTFYDYAHLFDSPLAERNLHGRVVDIAGRRIAGLGGIFRGQIWMPPAAPNYPSQAHYLAHCGQSNHWRGGLPRKHRSTIFYADYQALAQERADILVTHEAPSCHPYGFQALDQLANKLGVSTAFHGHQHDCLDYRPHDARLGFRAYGVTLRGITDEHGNIIDPGILPD
ncbi:metallophosphoesterase family protein [Chitinibacter tainanensis]|uniref:metallophosphoesterase family protein n=1 Tax=Chitinibacter tainanensis TaxID=230667 RepID=UPI00042A1502|nr:metallophosphoesterase [Chitinibacter tainanensis]